MGICCSKKNVQVHDKEFSNINHLDQTLNPSDMQKMNSRFEKVKIHAHQVKDPNAVVDEDVDSDNDDDEDEG